MMLASAHAAVHLAPLAGRGRIASAIRVRGSLRKGGENRFENTRQIAGDLVVLETQDAIVAVSQPFVSNGVALIIGMLTTVHLDNEATFASDEADCVRTNRFLPDELVATQPAGTEPIPKRPFGIRRGAAQVPGAFGLRLISTAHAETPPHPKFAARISTSPRKRGEVKA